MTVLTVVMGLAFSAFYRCHANSRNLRRNTEDIVRTLNAGERWREDVRSAIREPELVGEKAGAVLQIPRRNDVVVYSFADGVIWRNIGPQRTAFLKGVQNSVMQADARQQVRGWRWEVELASSKKTIPPLFTFEAVRSSKL
jgi:hypothetical protein